MADTYAAEREANAARGQSYIPRPAPPPVLKSANPSCFGNIEEVRGTCEAAADRVERAVSRLCGSVPTEPRAGERPAADGLFSQADEQARDIRKAMDRIFAALDRLESQLP